MSRLSIVIVDSGMGGLSICADIAAGFEGGSHGRVELTYFNAWPEQKRGYNSLPAHDDRVRVFNSALESIESLQPDLILIACNTLSILYPETPFAGTTRIPVVGVIDFGVRMVYEQMQAYPDSQAIILGTLTTVNSKTHQRELEELGILSERIIGQQCNQLATLIESGPEKAAVEEMIDGFLCEALEKVVENDAPVFAVFCCTHFGYAQRLFEKWFKSHMGDRVIILNPNTAMSEYVLNTYGGTREEGADISVRVLSRIIWDDVKVEAIAETLDRTSPITASALRDYHQDPDLFEV